MKWVKRGGQRVPPDTKTAGVGTAGGADLRVSGGGGGGFQQHQVHGVAGVPRSL